MKKCNNCGKVYENEFLICDICEEELTEFDEMVTEERLNVNSENSEKTFCVFCGGAIHNQQTYCSHCGKSSVEENVRHCVNCGTQLAENQKFCSKCGEKISNIVIPKSLDDIVKKIQKIDRKKVSTIAVALVIVVLLVLASIFVVPQIFVSTEEYLSQGNYIKAYEKASNDEKESVLIENLIASLCADAKSGLKNEDSFKLKKAWYDRDSKNVVLEIQGTNSYGGTISNYWYYTFDDEEQVYEYFISVSDFEEEEMYSWDDLEEKLEKIIENAAKITIKEIIQDETNELDLALVQRINGLNEQDLLPYVELIEEVKSIYPIDSQSA